MIGAVLLLGRIAQQAQAAQAKPRTLHEKIAVALGWQAEEAQRFSLQALRDLVRPVSLALAQELTDRIESGNCCR